jgi:hypothetical protein
MRDASTDLLAKIAILLGTAQAGSSEVGQVFASSKAEAK